MEKTKALNKTPTLHRQKIQIRQFIIFFWSV